LAASSASVGPAMYRLPVALSWMVAPQAFVWLSKLMWHSEHAGALRVTLGRWLG